MKNNDETNTPKPKNISPTTRKWLKCLHVFFSIVWLGNIMALGLLLFLSPKPTSDSALHFYHIIFQRVDLILVATTAMGSLVTALIVCWKTNWGFFRYWWIIVKLILACFVIIYSTLFLAPLDHDLIDMSKNMGLEVYSNESYISYTMRVKICNLINICILLFLTYLSYFKPWGKVKDI